MAWLIVTLLLVLFLVFLLTTPIVLRVDSVKGECMAGMTGVATVAVLRHESELIRIRARVFFCPSIFTRCAC